jgi:hypothetical protein
MATAIPVLQVYEKLATWYEAQGQAKLRDWFLVLAADSALSNGKCEQCEQLRRRLLHANPHHLLRPFASFAEALRSPDVRSYIAELRKHYPAHTALQLLKAARKKASAAATEKRELKVYHLKDLPESPPTPATSEGEDEAPPQPEADLGSSLPIPELPKPAFSKPKQRAPMAWKQARRFLEHGLPTASFQPPMPEPDEPEIDLLSYWVSTALFVATLLIGLFLAVWVLAGTFF